MKFVMKLEKEEKKKPQGDRKGFEEIIKNNK